MSSALARFRLLSFDCYGTLIDWETGISRTLADFARRAGLDREALLALFARHETAVQQEVPRLPYAALLARVLRRMAEEVGVALAPGEAVAFGASVGTWPPFADSPAALRRLARRATLVVLSNVDRASFAASARALGVRFDRVITAEEMGCYKPDPRTFEVLRAEVAHLGFAPQEHLHVAQSLYHDILPARRAGIATCWIDRRGGQGGGATPEVSTRVEPDFRFSSLAALAEAYEAAGAGPEAMGSAASGTSRPSTSR